MTSDCIEIESRGAVAWLWMNRPDVHNAFDEALIAALTSALVAQDHDDSVRVIVLAGRGKSFSAGADLNWMKRQGTATAAENLADARRLAALFATLSDIRKPTIARVHGAAMGGGMGLAAACSICLASHEASFATSEVRLGLIPSVISPFVIRAIGARQAARFFLSGERISAARAEQIGLAHQLATAEELDQLVQSVAEALLKGGPQAQIASATLIRTVAGCPITPELLDECAKGIATLRGGSEAKDGLSAFLEKRTPAWMDV